MYGIVFVSFRLDEIFGRHKIKQKNRNYFNNDSLSCVVLGTCVPEPNVILNVTILNRRNMAIWASCIKLFITFLITVL